MLYCMLNNLNIYQVNSVNFAEPFSFHGQKKQRSSSLTSINMTYRVI
jgi:hypothetical protein